MMLGRAERGHAEQHRVVPIAKIRNSLPDGMEQECAVRRVRIKIDENMMLGPVVEVDTPRGEHRARRCRQKRGGATAGEDSGTSNDEHCHKVIPHFCNISPCLILHNNKSFAVHHEIADLVIGFATSAGV